MLSFWIISIPLLFLVIAVLYKFVSADGDFTLMSKGHVKREEIEDKVIWITGASRGIGEILAKQLAGLGAKLILSARNESELERVKKQLSGKYAPHEVVILPLDLASGEDLLREAVEKAETCFDGAGVDYLIHNAAYERPKSSALEVSEQALKATFEVNTLGPISLTRMLSPYMVKRGRGHFVVMSSAAGKTPAPGQAVYSATKFALNGYFHTLRSELHHKGIKVTVVCPGPIKTPSTPEVPTSSQKGPFAERRVSCERCAELTIIAASHGLKEAWISYQPVLGVMYLVQYVPSVGFWLMDKMGSIPSEQSQDCGPRPTLMVISSSEAVIQAHRNIGVGATMNNQSTGGSGSTGTGGEGGPPASKPKQQRVRARRGQATEPQSIAERLCRERNAERMTALQELVPNANKLVSHNSFSIFFFFSIL